MACWLMKSEPETYGISDLVRDGRTQWEGVRNYSARIHLRKMAVGDRAFFYHSGIVRPEIVGEVRITRPAYPDPSQFDPKSAYYDPGSPRMAPRWVAVDVAFVRRYPHPVSRDALRAHPALRKMAVLGHTRLSVTPVSPAEWRAVESLAG